MNRQVQERTFLRERSAYLIAVLKERTGGPNSCARSETNLAIEE